LDSASERIAIARALHDGFAQDLVALRYRVEFLADSPTIDVSDARELKKISIEISHITEDVRRELFNLREPMLSTAESSDFPSAIESLIEPFRTQIEIDFHSDSALIPPRLCELFIYITPELIRNTLSHAGASRIAITITQLENSLQFNFSDNGRGGAGESELRYGLTGIRELVEINQGSFSIDNKGGSEICLSFPSKESSL
jgi:signal transduction histidine kinase